jgi:photosystem II stability/assembly factor-like uncharacterized protein
MHLRLEWITLPAAALLIPLAGCGGAEPTAVALPGVAKAVAVAPDFAGTLWETTGGRAWRSHDGGLSWQRVRGPGGGDAIAFTEKGGVGLSKPLKTPQPFVSITTPYHRTDRLYALDVFGHPWVSVDAGRHWSRLRAGRLPNTCRSISAVRGDVTQPDVIYAACGDDGLWLSLDDGAQFTRVPAPAVAYGVAMTTDNQAQVLVAGDKLYLSTDHGHSFRPVLDRRVDAVAYDPRNEDLAYAAVGHRLLRSVDGGRTWPRVG